MMTNNRQVESWHGWPPQFWNGEKWVYAPKEFIEKVSRPMTEYNLDKVAAVYLKIRDARAANKKAWEEEDRNLKNQLETLAGFFLEKMKELDVKSVKTTAHGTVYRSTSIKPQGADWNAFYAWIIEQNAFEALERRIKKAFIKTYMEEHDGALPPGVTVFTEYTVTIRRSNQNIDDVTNDEEEGNNYDDN